MDAMAKVPNEMLAGKLAALTTGQLPVAVQRFPTGSQHYVYEARFADRPPVVVRIADATGAALMVGASTLSHQLRPLGVPLPEILAEDLTPPFPYLVLERLPGTDLGHVVAQLPEGRLAAIAAAVARAQAIVASTSSSGRYGYAIVPGEAPADRWSQVVEANLERSRGRTLAAGLFDLGAVRAVAQLAEQWRPELDAQAAVPFLHDTTTKNVIIAPDGAFSGIVDVDDLCFGDPRYVAALTLASLLVSGGPAGYVDAWLGQAGLADDRLFRLYVAVFLVDFMAEHGQVFNGNQRPSSAAARAHLSTVFVAALQRVGG
jgi:aminoglycoside phosphotransferase (APT) family kinase protein